MYFVVQVMCLFAFFIGILQVVNNRTSNKEKIGYAVLSTVYIAITLVVEGVLK